LLHVNLAASE